MSLFPPVFTSSTNKSEKNAINIKAVNGIYVPLKKNENKQKYTEGMSEIDINNFIKINQENEDKYLGLNYIKGEQQLILNDNITTRVFIGGISVFGVYILYKLLYVKGV
jgi:hypothetical protein